MILSELLMWWMDVWLVDKSILWDTIWNIQQVYFWINLLQVDRAFMYKKPIEHNVDAITRSVLLYRRMVWLLQWWCHITHVRWESCIELKQIPRSTQNLQVTGLTIYGTRTPSRPPFDLWESERKPLWFDGSRQTANYHISSMLPRLLVNREAIPSTKASPCLLLNHNILQHLNTFIY